MGGARKWSGGGGSCECWGGESGIEGEEPKVQSETVVISAE